MIKVEVLADSKFPVNRELIRERVVAVLAAHNVIENAEMAVVVVGKRKMTSLNEKYMKRHGPTDVLSFPLQDVTETTYFVSAPDSVLRLGDVVVCYPIALEQALEKQVMVDKAVCDLVEHGCLHLLGIHHD